MSEAQPTFLYVEDDFMSREVVKVLMNRVLGYTEFYIFEDSSDFMARVAALPAVPTVIFLDIQLKPHNGYEMLAMLRTDAAYAACKIIAMTANVMATDVDALKEAGFDGLIGKPLDRHLFPDLLNQILNGEAVWFVM